MDAAKSLPFSWTIRFFGTVFEQKLKGLNLLPRNL
jgi:hypothetical protein